MKINYQKQAENVFKERGFHVDFSKGSFTSQFFNQPSLTFLFKKQPSIRFVGEKSFLEKYLQKNSLTEKELVGSAWVTYFNQLSKNKETQEYQKWREQAKESLHFIQNILKIFSKQVKNKNFHIHIRPFEDGNATTCFGDPEKQKSLWKTRNDLSQQEKTSLLKEMRAIFDSFFIFFSRFTITRDIFTAPITKRGLLVHRAFSRVAITRGDSWDPLLGYIFSIFYLYGGELYGLYPASSRKVTQKWKGVLGYMYTPRLLFQYRGCPFTSREHEFDIIKDELHRKGFDFVAPYDYSGETGEQLRSLAHVQLQKQKKTKAYQVWEKAQEKWKKNVGNWHDLFYVSYKKRFDFSLKLYDYGYHIALTIKDDVIESLNDKEDIIARQERHKELLTDFAGFLYDGFLNNKKGFGKCLYEE